jgi:drug/metabolite transporter (DMT)-like permease
MKLKIWVGMLVLYIVWGTTYLAIRFAVETMPPFLMAATRFIIPGVILYAWRRLRGDQPPTRNEWRSAAIVALLLLVGGNGLVTWAEQFVPSGITALIVASAPIWMVLIDALRPGGRWPSFQTVFGVLLGFAGITLLIWNDFNGSTGSIALAGMVALVLASIFWAAGSIYNRNACLPQSALLGTGMEFLVGGAALALLATVTGEWGRLEPSAISANSLLGLLYLIVLGSIIGFATYTWLLRVAPTPLVSTYAYVNPLIAIFMGYWLAQEPLSARILISALVIISSVAIINTSRMTSPQVQEATTPSAPYGND